MNGTNKLINCTSYVETCYILDEQVEFITRFPTDESILVYLFAMIFVVILIFTTISLNGITVITIQRSRALKEKQSNFTILMQSIVDLANGVLILPLIAVHLASQAAGTPRCVTIYVVKKFAILMFSYTLTTLSAMNFERYMGILHPFRHRILVTNERLLAYVVGVCVTQTVIYSFTFTHHQIIRPVFNTTILLFLFTTVFVYWKIFFTMCTNNRIGRTSNDINTSQDNRSKMASEKRKKRAQFLKELKLAKSSCLVVMSCLVCCLPSMLAFGPLYLKGTFEAVSLKIFFVMLAMLNSTLNSIIYFWMNNMLRKHGMDMVKNIWKSLKTQANCL